MDVIILLLIHVWLKDKTKAERDALIESFLKRHRKKWFIFEITSNGTNNNESIFFVSRIVSQTNAKLNINCVFIPLKPIANEQTCDFF